MLLTRVLTVLVALPLFLGLTWLGGWPFAVLVAALAVLAYREYARLWAAKGLRVPLAVGGAGTLTLVLAAGLWGPAALPPALLLSGLALLVLPVFFPDRWNAHEGLIGLAGTIYCGWLMAHWILLRHLGLNALLFAFVCTWVTDTFAYFGGRALGRHKLAPKVSPGKTVEGFVIGALGAAAVGAVLGPRAGAPLPAGWVAAALLGLAVSLVGQAADLAESALKRYAGAKDSGVLLPGHGGILDRFDSALFTLPLVYYVVTWLGA